MGESENTTESRLVRVGKRDVIVGRFKGWRATRVAQEAARIGRRYPRVAKDIEKFKREYAEANQLTLSRTEAEYRLHPALIARVSEEAWTTTGGTIKVSQQPSVNEQIAAVLPDVMEHAERHLNRLVALFAIDDDLAREAWRAQRVDEVLDELGEEIMFEADAEEIVELIAAGVEIGQAQFEPLEDRVGKALNRIGITRAEPEIKTTATNGNDETESSESRSPDKSESSEESSTEPRDPEPTSLPSSETSRSSSTDSQVPTDGESSTSFSRSPGSSSEDSSNGSTTESERKPESVTE